MTPQQRTLRARIAAHASWANTADPAARTAPARAAYLDRFTEEARSRHPDASDAHIARVAEHLKREHFTRLSYLSAKARKRTATTGTDHDFDSRTIT